MSERERSVLTRGLPALVFLAWLAPFSLGQTSAPVEAPAAAPGGAAQTAPAAPAPDQASEYLIGPQDLLDIEVFGMPELTKTVRVSSDGTIVLALLGRVRAAGLTDEQLRQQLETLYGKTYLQNPQVAVYVREVHSRPVSVTGAVDHPGVFQLPDDATLIDVISLAGGLSRTSTPAGRSIYVVRKGEFVFDRIPDGLRLVTPEKVEIDVDRLFFSRNQDLNIPIRPHDIITISQADVFYVEGGVRQASSFHFPSRDRVTVLQAVAMAGGLISTASRGGARIIRTQEDGSRTLIPIELGKIIKGQSADVPLIANDILYINDSTTKAALRRGVEAIVSTASGVTVYRAAR
jgi:polysaccharide export outer membrane protein